jgi:hypothetical protein
MFTMFLGLPLCSHAQWLNQPDPRAPRTKDGKPNLSGPTPRLRGKPDLSGVWQTEGSSKKELSSLFPPGVGLLPGGENGLGEDDPVKYFLNILADFKPGEEPLTAAGAAQLRELMQNPQKPPSLCQPPSVPFTNLAPAPFKIVQTPELTLILYEADTIFRQVYTDGRKHPVDPQPSWLGYSVGHWDGDSFVVDAVGFNDRSPLDAMGHPHSEALRVTERYRRLDFGHMELQVTVDDPKIFTKPITNKVKLRLLPDTDVIESFCTEDEKDWAHFPGN